MKIVSYNIRGLGGVLKKKEIFNLVSSENPDVVCIQESKLSDVDGRLCGRLCGDPDIGWACKEA